MVLHRSESRGAADFGWLKARYTVSFANYYDPKRIHFGVLRVLNDDIVAGGMGFGTHPHDNMEIITIPLEGAIAHKDSMGNGSVIHAGDIQVMSAGSGVTHSEFNQHADRVARLLQIWLFPNKKNVEPRYGQLSLDPEKQNNRFQQIVSPDPEDDGLWIHQDAWFHLGRFDKGLETGYKIKRSSNGLYIFVINGAVDVNGQMLSTRDGLGISDMETVHFLIKEDDTKILLMDIPVKL
jgi:redox-sensitive bicupin YhaK (pirin superfamily)